MPNNAGSQQFSCSHLCKNTVDTADFLMQTGIGKLCHKKIFSTSLLFV